MWLTAGDWRGHEDTYLVFRASFDFVQKFRSSTRFDYVIAEDVISYSITHYMNNFFIIVRPSACNKIKSVLIHYK